MWLAETLEHLHVSDPEEMENKIYEDGGAFSQIFLLFCLPHWTAAVSDGLLLSLHSWPGWCGVRTSRGGQAPLLATQDQLDSFVIKLNLIHSIFIKCFKFSYGVELDKSFKHIHAN